MNLHLDNFEVFPWNDNLKTNISIIDRQHKKLVELLNLLTHKLVANDETELERIFNELADYAKYHFETEEAIWEPVFKDDAWFHSHQQAHNSFLPKVLALKEKHSEQPLHIIVENIIKFLIRWLSFHIIDSDKHMAIVLQKVESGLSLDEAKRLSNEEMQGSSKILIDTVLKMYEGLSSRTLDLMRERIKRKEAEKELLTLNHKLEELSITDQLTGLYNRRYFDEVFDRELRRARREKHFFTYIMLDIDHFKKLNDSYGHAQGDNALKIVSEKLKKICRRPGDFVFRIGGEEFGILISEQVSPVNQVFLDRIRTDIEDLKIPNEGSTISSHLTISIGVVCEIPTAAKKTDYFISKADHRLYKAKSLGRNNVIASD